MAIRKTENGYYVEVFLGKDPITGKKIRKTKTCKGLKEAKAFEAECLTMSARGEIEYNNKMALSNYLDYWYDTYVKVNCAYQTQKRYETFCKCIKSNIGHIRLDKLTPPIIQKFYSNLLLETIKRKNGTVVKRYSNGTVLKTHKMLHLSLKWAVTWQMIHINPTDNVMPPNDDSRNIEVWSLDEVNAFMSYIKETTLYPAANLAYRTGMREGEISALDWENVDYENKVIHVKYNMVEKKGGKLFPEEPKTETSKRDIDIDAETAAWLKKLHLKQKEIGLEKGITYKYVCCWPDGRPLRPQYITKSFKREVEKHKDELKQITFHGLRHTHASILFNAGISSNVISKRLGHARTSITDDIYIHVKPQKLKEAADAFAEAIKNVK